MAMKVISFKVEGNEVQLPSNASLVEGIDNAIDTHIAAYDNSTVDAKIAGLSNVYLGKTAKAADSAKADYATSAGKATNDGSGNAITTTYYKKTDTVDRAAADDQGNNFRQKYALITGTVANAQYATLAGAASKATLDSGGNNILSTYIKELTASGQTVTYKRGDNTTGTFTTKDTTYNAATTTAAGLMSAADKVKLNALSTDTSTFIVSNAATADQLTTARNISIGGGASGSASFNGSADAKITLGSINAASITSGTLAVARGGTGQTALSNVTVGKASKLETARTVALKGAVTGSTTFDGSANVTIATSALDVSTATAGTLAVARGGTGQTTLALARNAMGLGNTTGALPVANGGTGLTASPSMLTNLASTSAANVMAASPRPGVTGTLGVANGGTGQTALANVTVGKADKLTTARKITIAGYTTGSTTFDGSGDVTLSSSWSPTVLDPATTPDLNTVNNPGWYKTSSIRLFNHYPTHDGKTPYDCAYIHVVGHIGWSSRLQVMYRRWGGPLFSRVSNDYGQTWSSWQKFDTTTVQTYESVEGGDS